MPSQSWLERPRVMAVRRRWRAAEFVAATLDGFRRHRTGRNAAVVAHFGFLSVFPLLLVATTILGFVLQNRPGLREDIIDSALAQLPFVGQQIAVDPSRLRGNTVVLVLGLIAALWSGMRAFTAMQGALDDVAEVPLDERSNLVQGRLRALTGIGVVGAAQVGTGVLSALIGAAEFEVVGKVLLLVATVAINIAVLAATFRWLCSAPLTWRGVVVGAAIGGVLFAALQLVGATVVQRSIAQASPVYGTFATVIALLSWLSLHTTIALVCAEVNQVLHPHRPVAEC
jgi:YihY family inner membrane protein